MASEKRVPFTHVRWAEILLVAAVILLLGLDALPARQVDPPPAASLVHRIDLNRSPWHELVHLPGIGPSRAREIVRDRGQRGLFASPEDLLRVRGIGPVTVRAIHDRLFDDEE